MADHAAAFIEQAHIMNMLVKTSGRMIHKQRKGPKKKRQKKSLHPSNKGHSI